ncbi:GOLPH3/VPS74 family protein [Kitasatospora sp. NBC_00458]|uniref:GOLPH3/VPS74 family protein n=1 Tax=Kitasatospora sp. NBC_00458 TaxID=2903568 RepID=UPI002E18B667
MAPLDSGPRGRRSIPEELVLLCTDPAQGTLRVSTAAFYRVLAGGVLADLLLAGGVTVEDRRITAFQPLGASDEITAGVLARLAEAGKRRYRLGLDHVLRQVPRKESVEHFRARLVADGAMTVERRRLLLIPYRAHLPVPPTAGQDIADRIAALLTRLETGAGGSGSRAADGRDLQLAGLVGAGRFDRRLFPGPENAALRKTLRKVVKELPVARSVRRLVDADNSSGG